MTESGATELHPLACPRCNCTERRILQTRRYDNKKNPQPLPGVRRTNECQHCHKQFTSIETIEEVDLQSDVWKVTTDGKKITDAGLIPAGDYTGLWTAFEVLMQTRSGDRFVLHTRNCMRAEDYPCKISVTKRGIRVESVTL